MSLSETITLYAAIAYDSAGPVVALLLVKRRTGSWNYAVLACLIAATVLAYCITGGLAWLGTYLRVCVQGDTTVPDGIGMPVANYLAMTFGVCGIYGVMFAGVGLLVGLPLVGVWRVVHPRSFQFVIGRRPGQVS